MSLNKTNGTTAGMAALGARAKDAAAQAVPVGKRAGTTAVQGARQGVQGAKEWATPRVQRRRPGQPGMGHAPCAGRRPW